MKAAWSFNYSVIDDSFGFIWFIIDLNLIYCVWKMCVCFYCISIYSCLYSVVYSVHGKNDFAELFKNVSRYRSENNMVGPLK